MANHNSNKFSFQQNSTMEREQKHFVNISKHIEAFC